MLGANLDYAILKQTQIDSASILDPKAHQVWEIVNQGASNSNLNGIDLSHTTLFQVDLSNADLSDANLNGTNLSGANLKGAYLCQTNLELANLSNANLHSAYLSHANLSQVNFSGTNLNGAYLKDANLQFANFKSAQLDRHTIIDRKWRLVWEIVNQGAEGQELIGLNLSNANLRGANLKRANLSNSNLKNSDLRGANFSEANLTNVDLTHTQLQGVHLEDAILTKAKVPADLPNLAHKRPVSTKISSAQIEDTISESPESNTATMVSLEEPMQMEETTIPASSAKKKINLIIPLGLIILMAISGYFLFLFQQDAEDNSLPQQELSN